VIDETDVKPAESSVIFIGIHIKVTPIALPMFLINPTKAVAIPKEEGERYMVIHNFPSPGYVAEEDVLNRWEIIGVFRVKE